MFRTNVGACGAPIASHHHSLADESAIVAVGTLLALLLMFLVLAV
jgi:hypothetical protein